MAATDALPVPRKNAAFRITFPILDADGDLVSGAATLDSEVSIDGATFADVTAEATEIATSSGIYFLDLTAAEMNGDTIAVIVKTSTGDAKTTPIVLYPEEAGDIRVNLTEWLGVAPNALATGRVDSSVGAMVANVLTAAAINADAITAAKIAAGAIDAATFAAGAIDAAAIANGAIDAATFAVGAIDDAAIAANAITAAKIAADAIGASQLAADAVDEIWDEAMAGHTTFDTFGALLKGLAIFGRVNDAGATTTDFDTDGFTEATAAHFAGSRMRFITGALSGQSRIISTYGGGAGQNCIFDRAWTEAPANNDEFVIIPSVGALSRAIATESDGHAHADLKEWLGVTVNALVSGRVDGSVGAMAASVITAAAINAAAITAAKFGAGAIDAAAIGTGAIDADALAADAITAAKIAAGAIGSSEAPNLDAAISSRATPAQVNTEVLDVMNTDAFGEPAGAPGVSTTLQEKISRIYQALRNRITITSTTKQFTNDSLAALWSKALSDDGTTYQEDEGI